MRRRYDSAVEELRGRGCAAVGYRLLGADGESYPLCCRYFYGQWRMHLAFPDPKTVINPGPVGVGRAAVLNASVGTDERFRLLRCFLAQQASVSADDVRVEAA